MNSTDDLSFNLNVDNLNSFYRLKYVFVEFGFDACGNQGSSCLKSKIKKMVEGVDSNVIVFYKLSIPN
ncbi:MAG: hypothetical protein IPF54_18875 [Draconibacterium sp.]|nr:hypothetical protein [Draconibacterium sp.]